jgi:hypothetical protein
MAVQERHDFPDRFLFGPRGQNAGRANRPNAVDFAQPIRARLDDVKYLLAEGSHQLLGVNRANAPDHAGLEVFLDAVSRIGKRAAQKSRFKLLAVSAIVDPFARGSDPLAGRNRCGMANNGYDIAVPASLDPQNAEAIIVIMEGYALHQASEYLLA